MNKITIAILSICVFAFSSCKKSSSSPSVVGKWAFSNISGSSVNNTSATDGYTDAYTFNSTTNILTKTTSNIGITTTNVSTIQVTTELWTFNSDGTYTINETYAESPAPAVTSTASGTWGISQQFNC